jgi:hypothetical protein
MRTAGMESFLELEAQEEAAWIISFIQIAFRNRLNRFGASGSTISSETDVKMGRRQHFCHLKSRT